MSMLSEPQRSRNEQCVESCWIKFPSAAPEISNASCDTCVFIRITVALMRHWRASVTDHCIASVHSSTDVNHCARVLKEGVVTRLFLSQR
jgi:hypothetical protein